MMIWVGVVLERIHCSGSTGFQYNVFIHGNHTVAFRLDNLHPKSDLVGHDNLSDKLKQMSKGGNSPSTNYIIRI